jgi:hypothetical protein
LPADKVEEAVKRFAGRFRSRRVLFQYLKAYKQLHEVLHELNDYLGQLRAEADARRTARTEVSRTTAAALRNWAADAARWWQQTEHPDAVPLWVNQLAKATEDFLGRDADLHPRALARLTNLPKVNLVALNVRLLDCARRLRADELFLDVNNVPWLIESGAARRLNAAADEVARRLNAVADAAERFRDPCRRLVDAICHDALCQEIDTQLQEAQGMGARSPDEVLGWDVVQGHLTKLAQERLGDLKVAATMTALAAFKAEPSARTFDRLREAFAVMFKAMDVNLLSVTTDLLLAAERLINSLEALG